MESSSNPQPLGRTVTRSDTEQGHYRNSAECIATEWQKGNNMKFYMLTCYGKTKVYYAKVDTLKEAIRLADLWDHATVQEKGIHNRYGGPARTVYERYNGVVTTH